MEKVLYYKGYYFKLKKENKDIFRYDYEDLKLSIYNSNNELLKDYKIEHDFTFYYKILKTKIKSSNILELFTNVYNNASVSNIFFNKLIEEMGLTNE